MQSVNSFDQLLFTNRAEFAVEVTHFAILMRSEPDWTFSIWENINTIQTDPVFPFVVYRIVIFGFIRRFTSSGKPIFIV